MTTWVLLRGLTRERAHWGAFPSQLEQAMPGADTVPIDLPGAGALWRRRCPWRVEDMVEACRQQLVGQARVPPYWLLGLSLGGMVASAWAASRPEEVAGCVVVNTSMRPFSPPHARLRWRQLPALFRLLLPRDARRAEQAILRLTSAAPERHPGAIDDWAAVRRERPVSSENALRQLFAAARYRHTGPAPSAPVLVVHSAHDALVDPDCSRALARQWRVELATHPDAGHDLPLDDGPWLAALVADWYKRNAPARGGPARVRSAPH